MGEFNLGEKEKYLLVFIAAAGEPLQNSVGYLAMQMDNIVAREIEVAEPNGKLYLDHLLDGKYIKKVGSQAGNLLFKSGGWCYTITKEGRKYLNEEGLLEGSR